MSDKPCVVFVGNPGVGKSTMLNGLIGRAGVFKSGVTYGRGMTYQLQINCDNPEYDLADTPGLADVELRKQAAVEIKKLFEQRSSVTIIFVVVLEAGRVRAEDVATVQLVLDSLRNAIPGEDTTNKFTIVINKLTKRVMNDLKTDKDALTRVAGCLNSTNHTTKYIMPFEKDNDLEDVDNAMAPQPLIQEIVRNSPRITIDRKKVKAINVETIEEVKAKMEARIAGIMKSNERELQNVRAEMARAVQEGERREAETRREMQRALEQANQEHTRAIANLNAARAQDAATNQAAIAAAQAAVQRAEAAAESANQRARNAAVQHPTPQQRSSGLLGDIFGWVDNACVIC